MIITTRYALLRRPGVWLEAGDTASAALSLLAQLGGHVYECVMCEGGARWASVAPSYLTRSAANVAELRGTLDRAMAIKAGR